MWPPIQTYKSLKFSKSRSMSKLKMFKRHCQWDYRYLRRIWLYFSLSFWVTTFSVNSFGRTSKISSFVGPLLILKLIKTIKICEIWISTRQGIDIIKINVCKIGNKQKQNRIKNKFKSDGMFSGHENTGLKYEQALIKFSIERNSTEIIETSHETLWRNLHTFS